MAPSQSSFCSNATSSITHDVSYNVNSSVSGDGPDDSIYCYYDRNRRGIQNVCGVSCHIASAVQILCHAIPPVRSLLHRFVVVEEKNKSENNFDFVSSSWPSLLRELVDFSFVVATALQQQSDECSMGGDNDNRNEKKDGSSLPPWNPSRFYMYLHERNDKFVLDHNRVGDATTSLSSLLQILSKDGGSVWKILLNSSVWEGETKQILEGRLPINCSDVRQENVESNDEKIMPLQRRFLQRVKPSVRNKPMSSPLVLKFRHAANHDSTHRKYTNAVINDVRSEIGGRRTTEWSVIQALNEIFEPQVINGSSYPWDTISPDSYSELEIVCRNESEDTGVKIRRSNSNDDIGWLTTKRLEIQRIPRVWLLHLDRPPLEAKRLRRSILDLCVSSKLEAGDCQDSFPPF